jgi:hypothetical protein
MTRSAFSPCALPRAFALIAIACLSALPACSGAADATTGVNARLPAKLIVVQGASQSGQAGRDLPTPIVLRVVDSAGVGMHGVTVTLAVADGGGTVTPASDTTDGHGEFKAKWTLGPGAISQSLTASTRGVAPVPILALGLLPTQIVLVQGNNQSAKPGSALANSVVVRVVGMNNLPMQGVTVGFQVLSGGGGMTPGTVVTNALGEASTKWTMGASGSNTALAVAGSLAPVAVAATATP